MKATKHKGTTYQLDESKFKPACIKFDQDMFDNEIAPVLVGLGLKMGNLNQEVGNLLVNDYNDIYFKFSRSPFLHKRTRCHTAQQFLEASGIFAVADELPKDWYIEVTEENLEELDAWRKRVASYYKNVILISGFFILSKHYRDESNFYSGYEKDLLKHHPNHKKIDLETLHKITNMEPDFSIKGTKLPSIPKGTSYRLYHTPYETELDFNYKTLVSYGLEEFKGETYVLADTNDYKDSNYFMFKLSDIERLWKEQNQNQNPKQDMKKFTITAELAQSIIDIACNAWKKQLAEKWANNIVLGNEIEISEEFYKEMRAACTPPQNELFDKIFGKDDDGSVNLTGVDSFELHGASNQMIDVRRGYEYGNKAFGLSNKYNWEIKRDSEGALCLIPTKKK